MRELHLFAGCGGGILGGILLGHECVGAVEINEYRRRALRARQQEGILPEFPIHDDIRTFDGTPWRGRVDAVCGGFPCTDISPAGSRIGITGPQSSLWLEMLRVVGEVAPRYVFVENSRDLVRRGLDTVLGGLADLGFDAEWCVLSAGDIGAPYQRSRTWILAAHPDRNGEPPVAVDAQVAGAPATGHAHSSRLAQRQGERCDACAQQPAAVGASWRPPSPGLLRRLSRPSAGVDSRQSRISAAGDTQIPAVAATAWTMLMARL